MLIIDNINKTVKEDLQAGIQKGSKMSVAAACFSIYAYQELKKQLEGIEELRFIFTSPTFITEKASKAQREFYIPRISRERSLYGTEFEVKLRNELTQKAIAKECADWIRHKVVFKSNVTQEQMMGFMTVDESTYMPINGFTTVDLGCERGNNAYYPVQKTESFENANYFLKLFEQLWNDKKKLQEVTDVVIENISAAYRENAPEYIYFVALYNIFKEFLDDISEDELPNEATGFKESKIWGMLYNFQRDAVLAIISKLEKFNGCILADSVGLGKTFTALAVIKYYENRNKSVLVLCPKKLSENWNTYKGNYVNNPIATDRLRYDVLYHTDLSREHGQSNGIDLDRLNWGNYDLVVIDESHNFRNGGEVSGEDAKENRYLKLLNKVVRAGVKTKVLMLSATPVNNKFIDLKNQLALAYEGDASQMNKKLDTTKSIDENFRQAQKSFNTWSKLPADERTTDELLRTLDFDFFELLDSVTIARSRKHIEKYYNTSDIGKFPERLPPISLRPCLTDLSNAINYNDIYNLLMSLSLTIYTPSNYIMPSKLAKYIDMTHHKGNSLTQQGREAGIRRLMSINLLKRLESSVASFRLTIDRIKKLIEDTIETIKSYQSGGCVLNLTEISDAENFDYDDQNTDFFSVGKKVKIFSFAIPDEGRVEFDSNSEYFLGPIVTFRNTNFKMEVIDGQQRLTTLMLLLRAFYTKFGHMQDKASVATKQNIEKCIWKTDEFGEPDMATLKIDSEVATDKDKNEFLDILRTGTVKPEQKSHYANNFMFFQGCIDSFLAKYPTYFAYLPTRIMNNCILLPIEAESQDTALRIFSTLNDRGMPLSDSDIFKAQFYKFYTGKGEKDAFIKRWKELEELTEKIFHPINGTPMDELFTRYMYFVRAKMGIKSSTTEALRKFYEKDNYALLKKDSTFNDMITLAHFWEDVSNQDRDRFSPRILHRLFVLNYAPNGMWTYFVSVYFMKNKDANGMLDDDAFYQFLNRITGFIWTYAVTNPGVNALRTPVYAEMVNIVNNRPVSFDGFKFEPATVKSMFANFTFSNTRPITKSMLAWWAFQDDLQELISLETVLEIEHIYL